MTIKITAGMCLHVSFTGKERSKDSCSKFHMRRQSHLSSHHCPQYFTYNYIVSSRCPYYFSYHFSRETCTRRSWQLSSARMDEQRRSMSLLAVVICQKATAVWLSSDFRDSTLPQSRIILRDKLQSGLKMRFWQNMK